MIAEKQLQQAETQRGQVESQRETFRSGWRYDQARFERYMNKLIMSAEFQDAPALFSVFLRLELEGGECPDCRVPWHQVHTGGKMGGFAYFDPTCRCYPRCNECGSSHHRAVALGPMAPNAHEAVTPCPSCKNAITRVNKRLERAGNPRRVATGKPSQLLLPVQ